MYSKADDAADYRAAHEYYQAKSIKNKHSMI